MPDRFIKSRAIFFIASFNLVRASQRNSFVFLLLKKCFSFYWIDFCKIVLTDWEKNQQIHLKIHYKNNPEIVAIGYKVGIGKLPTIIPWTGSWVTTIVIPTWTSTAVSNWRSSDAWWRLSIPFDFVSWTWTRRARTARWRRTRTSLFAAWFATVSVRLTFWFWIASITISMT